MTDLDTIENFSYACIDVKPMDYEFSGERWAEATSDGSGWRVMYGTIVPNGLDTEVEDGKRVLEFESDNFEISVTDEDGEDTQIVAPDDEGYDDLAEKFELDGNEIRRHIDGEDDGWNPMMNYAYPLDREPPEDWKTCVVTCTCVEIDGNYYLALTGGGMDLSWEICESYMRLGYFPPAHFAQLPAMAGRGISERDKWIIEGCRKTFEAMQSRSESALHGLDRLVQRSQEYASDRV